MVHLGGTHEDSISRKALSARVTRGSRARVYKEIDELSMNRAERRLMRESEKAFDACNVRTVNIQAYGCTHTLRYIRPSKRFKRLTKPFWARMNSV